jgi:phage terminase large subunit
MTAAPSTPSPTVDNRPYTPWGACLELWRARETEIMVSGPAGTGKSRACMEKLHWCAEKYPGMRALIFRKRRVDVTESALVTWEDKVLPTGHPALGNVQRQGRHSYTYPNGSIVVVGGLDDPGKVMSTEYDLAFAQEARELDEGDWESVSIRCRNGKMPYQQLIGDTNPDGPHHWIKRRAAAGTLRLLESRHEDNPAMFDRRRGEWTAAGRAYLARLDELTGVRRDRLRRGLWTQAEGLVYDAYDPATHVIEPFAVPRDWPRYWSVDFGFTNPFVCQWWAADPDGRLHLYREIYRTGRLVEDHARHMLELVGMPDGGAGDWSEALEPRPRAVVCDHDAEDRATLTRYLRMGTVPAIKDVSPGLQAVAGRLRVAGDGRPRLVQFRGALVERDRTLYEAHRPTCTAEEWESYIWDTGTGRKQGEAPAKRDDHGMDATRYVVMFADRAAGLAYTAAETPERTILDDAPPGAWGRDLR